MKQDHRPLQDTTKPKRIGGHVKNVLADLPR
jgi:hypothetical protein